MATFMKEIRLRALREKARLLNVHGGDMYQGTPAVNASRGRCMLPVLEALNFHIGILGNHEWDYGADGLDRLMELPRPLMVTTNISGLRRPHWNRLVYQVGSHRLGFLGYTIPDTWRRAPPGATEGLTFHSGERLAQEAQGLRDRGVDTLILITHTDRNEAEQLGRDLGADLVLGAHTNEVIQLRRSGGDGPWFQQAGCHLQNIAWLRLEWDPAGNLKPPSGQVEDLSQWPADPEMERIAEPFVAPYRDHLSRLVTRIDHTLYMGPWGGHSTLVAVGAQGIRDLAGAEFGILNIKAVREHTLGPGEIYGHTLYEAFPYENKIAVLRLTGQQLVDLYEANTASPFRPPREGERWTGQMSTDSRGVLQPAGFTVELDPTQPPGQRIHLRDALGKPLSLTESYEVATSNFLAEGGDGHEVFRSTPHRILELSVLEAITERFASHGNRAHCGPGGLRNLTHEAFELSCSDNP
jgi:2',3'-cyclic-nucleotide 2'-phosphodiesterase/3'-nucleotidase